MIRVQGLGYMVEGVGLRAKQDAWKIPRQNTHEQKTLKNVQEKKHLEMSPSEPSVPRKIPALSQGTQTQLKPMLKPIHQMAAFWYSGRTLGIVCNPVATSLVKPATKFPHRR